jgi:flavin-dependent dehydrogenase
MGWWEGFDFPTNQLDMIFDKNVSPLYGWMFPEAANRVNIGICIDGQDGDGVKSTKNLRATFQQFLDDHYAAPLKKAKQIGHLKGHPIVYTTWVEHLTAPGQLFLGEAGRLTHNATGEGISQAMQSGLYAAEALAKVLKYDESEDSAWSWYLRTHQKRFTTGFIAGHALRAIVKSPLLDKVADAYNNPFVRKAVVRLLGSALAGSAVSEAA